MKDKMIVKLIFKKIEEKMDILKNSSYFLWG